MKSVGLLATFALILCGQNVRGQQNGLFNNQNTETNNFVSQHQPSQTMANAQRFLNQNGKNGALNSNFNPRQRHMELNSPSLTNMQKVQQPLDVKQTPPSQSLLQQQQSLPVQQFAQEHQPLQSQQPLQTQQSLQMQQLGFQQNPLEQMPTFQENIDLIQTPIVQQQMPNMQQQTPVVQQQTPIMQQQSNYEPPNAQIHLNLLSTNPPGVNIVQPCNTQNIQPPQNLNLRPVEVIAPQQTAPNTNQDVPAITYHISSQQPLPLSPSNPPVVSNPPIALIPSYNINPVEQSYIPPYNYIKTVSEIQPAVIDQTATNPVPALPSIITLPSPVVQNTQTAAKAYYYGQPSDPRQNVYVNQNTGYRYPHQSQTSLTAVQAKPTAVIASQPSVLSPVPVSIVQAPQVSPQYAISSYPAAVMSPAYTTQNSKSLNLKTFLPLILNLLKEKITSCSCQNGCPCGCNKQNDNNNPEVLSGYSSQKHYGILKEDGPSILNTLSEESEGCLRKRKNCIKNEKVPEVSDVEEVSEESGEDEESDEEEISDDEQD